MAQIKKLKNFTYWEGLASLSECIKGLENLNPTFGCWKSYENSQKIPKNYNLQLKEILLL